MGAERLESFYANNYFEQLPRVTIAFKQIIYIVQQIS